VVPKLTMVQVDMHRYGIDELALRKKYLADGKDAERIFQGHQNQIASISL